MEAAINDDSIIAFLSTPESSYMSPPSMATCKLRVICLSDTHSHSPSEGYTLPPGDILLHAGDFTNQGSLQEIRKAVSWLEKADYTAKIVVAGNHDLSLDERYALKHPEGWRVMPDPEQLDECRRLVREAKDVTYLEHDSATVEVKGAKLKFFGSPYSPDRGKQNWAFQYPDTEAKALWSSIPSDTDVLITHTPPAGHVDTSAHWTQGGCPQLARALEKVRPKLHLCGHCHEGRGAEIVRWDADDDEVQHWQDPGRGSKKMSLLDLTSKKGGEAVINGSSTAVINASIMAKSWGRGGKAFNKPVVVDVEVAVHCVVVGKSP